MKEQKPDFSEFMEQIGTILEVPIPAEAISGAKDFLSSWEQLRIGITSGSIRIWPSMSIIRILFPEFARHQIWRRASIIIAVLTIFLIFFSLKFGLILLIMVLVINFVGILVRYKDSRKFVEQITKEANENLDQKGMALICAHYVVGTIGLVLDNTKVHWPQQPSHLFKG